jgi:hypothetical protein
LQPSSESPKYLIDATKNDILGVKSEFFIMHYNIEFPSMIRTIRIFYIKKDGSRFFKGQKFTAEDERRIIHEQSNETKLDRPTHQSSLTMDCA